jgi:conjugative transfer region protein TrbK
MQRPGRLVIGATVAGLMVSIALVMATTPERGPAAPPMNGPVEPATPEPAIGRCRTITQPDPQCEAVWDDRRQHFFGADRAP